MTPHENAYLFFYLQISDRYYNTDFVDVCIQPVKEELHFENSFFQKNARQIRSHSRKQCFFPIKYKGHLRELFDKNILSLLVCGHKG